MQMRGGLPILAQGGLVTPARNHFRLSALVNLQTQPLKGIFRLVIKILQSSSRFSAPVNLCLKLHINYQATGPTCPPLLLPLSLLSPPTPPSSPIFPHAGGGAPSPPLAAAPAHQSRGRCGPAPSVGGATGAAATRRRSRGLAPLLPPELAASMDPSGGKPAEIVLPAMDPRVDDGGPASSADAAAARQADRVAPCSPSSRRP
jgi:hypothetical protein